MLLSPHLYQVCTQVVRLVFAQWFITIFNCHYHTSNHLSVCHKHTSLSPINCQSVDNCCIIINTLINHHIIKYNIHLYHSYLSVFFVSAGVPNREFPEILITKCRSRFFCNLIFSRAGDFESWREGRKGPSKSGENAPAGRFTCMTLQLCGTKVIPNFGTPFFF